MDGLNMEILGGVRVPTPPIIEQDRILQFVATTSGELQSLIEAAERAIDLLNERRIALISAAVTGQIDVRDVAARSAA